MDEEPPAQRSFYASATALFVACAGVSLFVPPLLERVDIVSSPLLISADGLVIGTAFVAHVVFLGATARRLSYRALPWCLLACLFPIAGSAIALTILGWFGADRHWRKSS